MYYRKQTYKVKSIVAAVFMAMTLAWLTVSIPFVNAAWQQQKVNTNNTLPDTEDSTSNPFANTTEEKAPSSSTLSEEYLHHDDEQINFPDNKLCHTHHHSYDVYVAFHGELLSPPPEA